MFRKCKLLHTTPLPVPHLLYTLLLPTRTGNAPLQLLESNTVPLRESNLYNGLLKMSNKKGEMQCNVRGTKWDLSDVRKKVYLRRIEVQSKPWPGSNLVGSHRRSCAMMCCHPSAKCHNTLCYCYF